MSFMTGFSCDSHFSENSMWCLPPSSISIEPYNPNKLIKRTTQMYITFKLRTMHFIRYFRNYTKWVRKLNNLWIDFVCIQNNHLVWSVIIEFIWFTWASGNANYFHHSMYAMVLIYSEKLKDRHKLKLN